MKKEKLPLIVIAASVILIALNIIFTSDSMDAGFWVRNLSSLILIMAMLIKIRAEKKEKK